MISIDALRQLQDDMQNSIRVPNLEAEFPHASDDMLSRMADYGAKTLIVSTEGTIALSGRELPVEICDYLVSIGGFSKGTQFIQLDQTQIRPEAAILHSASLIDQLSQTGKGVYFPYRFTSKSVQISEKLGIEPLRIADTIDWMGDKRNLTQIFPGELLPEQIVVDGGRLYLASGRELLGDEEVIIKDPLGAASKGVWVKRVSELTVEEIGNPNLILQEKVQFGTDDEGAMIFSYVGYNGLADKQPNPVIFQSRQVMQEKEGGFKYVGHIISPTTINATQSAIGEIMSAATSQTQLAHRLSDIPLYGVDFGIRTDGRPVVIEINPRMPGSAITGYLLHRTSLLESIVSGGLTAMQIDIPTNVSTADMFNRLKADSLLVDDIYGEIGIIPTHHKSGQLECLVIAESLPGATEKVSRATNKLNI